MLLAMLVLMLLAHRVTIFFWGRLQRVRSVLNSVLKANRLLRGRCDEPYRPRLPVNYFKRFMPLASE